MPTLSSGLLGEETPRGAGVPGSLAGVREPPAPTSSRVGAVPPSLGLAWKRLTADGCASGQPGGQLGLGPWHGRPQQVRPAALLRGPCVCGIFASPAEVRPGTVRGATARDHTLGLRGPCSQLWVGRLVSYDCWAPSLTL